MRVKVKLTTSSPKIIQRWRRIYSDAIVWALKERDLKLTVVEEFDSTTGKGVTGKVDGKLILLGQRQLFSNRRAPKHRRCRRWRKNWGRPRHSHRRCSRYKLAGIDAIANPVEVSTPATLKTLGAGGIKVIMLTGYNRPPRTQSPNGAAFPTWGRGASGPEERHRQ